MRSGRVVAAGVAAVVVGGCSARPTVLPSPVDLASLPASPVSAPAAATVSPPAGCADVRQPVRTVQFGTTNETAPLPVGAVLEVVAGLGLELPAATQPQPPDRGLIPVLSRICTERSATGTRAMFRAERRGVGQVWTFRTACRTCVQPAMQITVRVIPVAGVEEPLAAPSKS